MHHDLMMDRSSVATAPTADSRQAWTGSTRTDRSRRAAAARKASKRRRQVDPTTSDRDYSAEELEFMQAMQLYKQWSGRMFPTWSEVLEVLQGLGYSKDLGDHAAAQTARADACSRMS